jgi:putative transposase
MKSHTSPALRAIPAAHVQISMPVQGVLRDVRHAFLGLCIDAGQQVLAAMMEGDRVALCGAKGVPDATRRAVRGGSTAAQVVLGGQRIGVRRLRARSLDDGELALPTYEWAAAADALNALNAATMAAIAAGVSTRRYESTKEPVPEKHRPLAASKSAVSRRFVTLSKQQLGEWLGRRLDALDLALIMIDGIHFRERVILVALGIDSPGQQARAGLARGFHRGHWRGRLTAGRPHRPRARRRSGDAELESRRLHNLAGSLQAKHPGAAASLREALDETLTAQQLGLSDALYRTLRSTNPIENLNGSIARYTRNVKQWRDGAMVLRWVASALADAATRMRKLRGCAQMKTLLAALAERDPDFLERAQQKAA